MYCSFCNYYLKSYNLFKHTDFSSVNCRQNMLYIFTFVQRIIV